MAEGSTVSLPGTLAEYLQSFGMRACLFPLRSRGIKTLRKFAMMSEKDLDKLQKVRVDSRNSFFRWLVVLSPQTTNANRVHIFWLVGALLYVAATSSQWALSSDNGSNIHLCQLQ